MFVKTIPFLLRALETGVTVLPSQHGVPGPVRFPTFASMQGPSFDVAAIAAATQTTISMCFGTLYVAGDVFCSSDHAAVYGRQNRFSGTIESVPAIIEFDNAAQGTVTDPFGTPNACYAGAELGLYKCRPPIDIALRVDVDGNMIVWDTSYMHSGVEASLMAFLCVAALAIMLPYSKTLNAATGRTFDQFFGGTDGWMALAVSDIVVAAWWLNISVAARHGMLSTTNPLYRTVVSHLAIQYLAFARLITLTLSSTMASFFLLTKTHRVETRTSTEVALLIVTSLLAPLHAAPDYHALLEACTSAALLMIVARDIRACHHTFWAATLFVTTLASSVLGFVPLFVGSRAIPHGVEIILSLCTAVQLCAFGYTLPEPRIS